MRWVRPRSTLVPLGAGDDAREEVVGEDFLGAFFAAVDGEGDALVEEAEVGGLLAALDFVLGEGGEVLEQGPVVLAQFILRGEHLVERMIQLVVPRRRRLGGRVAVARCRPWNLQYRATERRGHCRGPQRPYLREFGADRLTAIGADDAVACSRKTCVMPIGRDGGLSVAGDGGEGDARDSIDDLHRCAGLGTPWQRWWDPRGRISSCTASWRRPHCRAFPRRR